MANLPKWATPQRLAYLVQRFNETVGWCLHDCAPCLNPFHRYEAYLEWQEWAIAEWKGDDREQRGAEWQALRRRLHGLDERGPIRGRFDATAQDAFFAEQPEYYLEGLGISGLTFKPFARVRIASSPMYLHVELGDALHGLSKAKRRKAIRYGKPLPEAVIDKVEELAGKAVRHYMAQR